MDATPRLTSSRPVLLIIALLGLAALTYQGYHLAISFHGDDTNHLETPLILATSRQLTEGPSVLYGPYDGNRPLVLCHAPLYYRLVALTAAPLVKAGVEPLAAARHMGRLLAFLAFLIGLAVTAKLARLDGPPRSAGLIAALLVATSPVFGSTPFTVRPDTLAITLQTFGALLALQGLIRRSTTTASLVAAYLLFAASACVKQHDLVALGTTSLILALYWWRKEVRLGSIVLAHLAALAVLAAYYGTEQWLTSGHMAEAVFRLPAAFRAVAPADWHHVGIVALEVAKRSIGLLALAAVALVAWPCRQARPARLDALLLFYLAAELAATAVLCKGSTGAWVNYAMQAVVWASLLVGRGLSRALEPTTEIAWPTLRHLLAASAALAATGLLLTDARLAVQSARNRQVDRLAVASLLDDLPPANTGPDALYFIGAPDHNRIYGSLSLAHDEWLYTAFEAVGAAELRRQWLQDALVQGSVRYVIEPFNPRHSPGQVPGLVHQLPQLGYELRHAGDRYLVWERQQPPDDRTTAATPAANSPSNLSRSPRTTGATIRRGVEQLGPGRPISTAATTDAGPRIQPDLGVPRLAAGGRRP